jgi:PhnB protein
MTSVVPMLSYEDVGKASEWLTNAFGFQEVERFEDDGRVTHAGLSHAGTRFEIGWPGPAYQNPKHHAETCDAAREWLQEPWIVDGVLVYVDDVDAHYARAREAGAGILREPEDQPFGRLYSAEDVEGHRWMFMTAS